MVRSATLSGKTTIGRTSPAGGVVLPASRSASTPSTGHANDRTGLRLAQPSPVAAAINCSGQIVGYAYSRIGGEHAVQWQPVPEPAGMSALIVGLACVIGRSRRKLCPGSICPCEVR